MFMLSMGETRLAARTAGRFITGKMMTRPETSSGVRRLASLRRLIGPSYSSPWFPPVNTMVGPGPPFTTVIGTMMDPQALSSLLWGTVMAPCCFPAADRFTSQETTEWLFRLNVGGNGDHVVILRHDRGSQKGGVTQPAVPLNHDIVAGCL